MAGLQNIPPHLYEAAEIDGAGPVQRFRQQDEGRECEQQPVHDERVHSVGRPADLEAGQPQAPQPAPSVHTAGYVRTLKVFGNWRAPGAAQAAGP